MLLTMRGVNFMKTSKTDWYKPDELKTAEELSRREQVVEQCDPRSDFGSYRRILLGDSFEASQIAEHNDLSPKRKLLQLKAFLRLEKIRTVLDLGCGIGVTSNVLSQLFSNAKVTAIDCSQDAIAYAKKHFPSVDFQVRVIEPGQPIFGMFDVIFAFEFYPFSRNCDAWFQSSVIKYCMNMVTPNGSMVIYQKWNQPQSMSAVFSEVAELCGTDLVFELKIIPHPKLPRTLPNFLNCFISKCLSFVGKSGFRHVVQIKHREGMSKSSSEQRGVAVGCSC